ncbi:HAD-IB family phosphatase [Legionella nautarum]|uniref:HAD-IB family phosphatase n=1 Tax=Legionella nautarum TaxID=45070 RepID=UPI00105596DB|nr:HAD-IB family phosphatase [Legionella nautarum]
MGYVNSELWRIQKPINVFFFDWDNTLSLLEGIDFLASLNGVVEQVHEITQRCMSTTGFTEGDYKKRLDLVKPTKKQIMQLAEQYHIQCAPGARSVIRLLKSLGKKIYIISAGIKSSILPLAEELGIHQDNILAVDVYFNAEGKYQGFNEQSDLAKPKGKAMQIDKIIDANQRSLLLGDGFTDWEAKTSVTRFVGCAGSNPKKWVKKNSDFYIEHTSLLSVLALGLTEQEQEVLSEEYQAFYRQGLVDIQEGRVLIKEHNNVYHTNS